MRLAHALPNVNATFITGCPWGPDSELEPLYERFYSWKYGAEPSGILYPHPAAPRLLDLYQAYAQMKGKTVKEVFHGGVFMLSPLRLSAEEAEQFVWWWSRGFDAHIAHMITSGLTGPVTPAGVVVVHLAEAIAIGFLRQACYGTTGLDMLAMVAPVDMRSTTRPYGRPEMATANLLFAQMARFYGTDCFLHSGASDANLPSNESGAQKAICTLSALLSGADAMIDAGGLAMCDGHSPIQMILDNELAGSLHSFLRPYDCGDAAIGFDTIAEAGPGGMFIWQEHTVERYREELWEPSLWNRVALEAWLGGDRKLDVDLARDQYNAIMAEAPPANFLSEAEEKALRGIIEG
jgi:trimethylamine--corrinoid protein Co-methyltransferase